MDNPVLSIRDEMMQVQYIEYGPNEREIRGEPSSNHSSSQHLTKGYYRSSSSSSSASSGKQLVKTSHHYPSSHNHATKVKGRLERSYNLKEDLNIHHKDPTMWADLRRPYTPSPKVHKKLANFYIESPSSEASSQGYNSPQRLSPSPEAPPSPQNDRLDPSRLMPPEFNLQLHPGMLTAPDKNSRISSIYDAYWHIPRPSLWCSHKGCGADDRKCSQCQLQEETVSTCSSTNPPPTFTAMDTYQPIAKKVHRCSCGAVFVATAALSTFVLILIAAFILYTEMVLKRTEYVPDPM